jgi:glycine/D-amino acid oxidase-like deaminating enzyme
MRVAVCGGGVVGAAIAFFLSRRGAAVTLIECAAVACAASGKSGGFLALDWCDVSPLAALARRSFALHADLASELDGAARWGYRRLDTYAGFAGPRRRAVAGGSRPWLSSQVTLTRRLGGPDTTAQIHPALFTRTLAAEAEAAGAEIRIGRITGLVRAGDRVSGVQVGGVTVPADAVVVAMGPWSVLAARWLPLPGVYGLKGHSLVFATGERVPAESLFLDWRDDTGAWTPEVYPRPDGTTYVCAISSESPLPVDPSAVAPDPGAIPRLEAMCRALSPVLADAEILAAQACFRPVTRDGLPLIGAVPGVAGAYVATGHSVWGMLNAPATGEAMAELILDGAAAHVDLTPFDPARLPPFDPARLRG